MIGTKASVLLLVILMMKITSATSSSSSGEAMRRVGFEEEGDGKTSSSSSLSRRSLKDVHLGFSHSISLPRRPAVLERRVYSVRVLPFSLV